MFCNICSKKYGETGHVCITKKTIAQIQIIHKHIQAFSSCAFCNQKATQTISNLDTCEDHAEDALAHRDNQRERGE